MTVLAGIIAPTFGVMLLGFLAAKLRWFDQASTRGLVLFVFNFAVPVLLFRSLARTELPEDIQWGFLLSFYGGSFAVFGLGMAAARFLFHRPLDAQAIFGMGAGFSNTVLLGIPVLFAAFGPEATLPVFLIIAFHAPLLMPLTAGLIQVGRGGGVAPGRQLRSVARELVRNPIIVGLLLGLGVNQAGLTLPGPVDAVAEILASSAVPCALFAMGAALAGYTLVGDIPAALVLVFLKLVVHPFLVWALAVPLLGLEGMWAGVAVAMAAMPSGVNVYLFGARYDAAPGVAARTVLLSTVGSVATLSVLLYLLKGG